MCFVAASRSRLIEMLRILHYITLRHAFAEIAEISAISGRKQPKKAQMAVISPVEAPQATWDLGMAGVARRAAWLPGENAKPRSATARSVSMCTPPFRSWSDPPFLSFPRPPSVPVEYRGPNAEHPDSRFSIATTTRHSLTLPTGNPRSFYPRSLELPKNQGRASRRTRFTFCFVFWGAHGTSKPLNE